MFTTTTEFAKFRNAALLALAFGISATGISHPVQAAGLIVEQHDEEYDCLSRKEVKRFFLREGYKKVDVRKTKEHYIYRVIAYVPLKEKIPAAAVELKHDDYEDDYEWERYVFLFDACEHEIVKKEPAKK